MIINNFSGSEMARNLLLVKEWHSLYNIFFD